jgi:hypothetical protein
VELTAAVRRLQAALGSLQLQPRAPEQRLLHAWADTWSGVGAIVAGLHRMGYDLHLTQYGDNTWRSTFYVTAQAQGGGAADAVSGTSAPVVSKLGMTGAGDAEILQVTQRVEPVTCHSPLSG